jgi:hypothetical protein
MADGGSCIGRRRQLGARSAGVRLVARWRLARQDQDWYDSRVVSDCMLAHARASKKQACVVRSVHMSYLHGL